MRPFFLMSLFFLLFTAAGVAFLFTTPSVLATSADLGLSEFAGERAGLPTDSPARYVATVIRWVLGLLGILLVGLFVYGGVVYATAAGNPNRADLGKQVLTYAMIGLVIISVSLIVSEFTIGAFRGTTTNAPARPGTTQGDQQFNDAVQQFNNATRTPGVSSSNSSDCFVNTQDQTCCRTSSGSNYTCFDQKSRNTDQCYVDGQGQLCCPNIFGRVQCSN